MNCPHCHSTNTRKHGKTPQGRQKWDCKTCGRTFVELPHHTHPTLTAEEMRELYDSGLTMAAIGVQAGCTRETVRLMLESTPGFKARNVGVKKKR